MQSAFVRHLLDNSSKINMQKKAKTALVSMIHTHGKYVKKMLGTGCRIQLPETFDSTCNVRNVVITSRNILSWENTENNEGKIVAWEYPSLDVKKKVQCRIHENNELLFAIGDKIKVADRKFLEVQIISESEYPDKVTAFTFKGGTLIEIIFMKIEENQSKSASKLVNYKFQEMNDEGFELIKAHGAPIITPDSHVIGILEKSADGNLVPLFFTKENLNIGLLPIRDAIEQTDGLDKGQGKGASKYESCIRLGIETGESVEKAKRSMLNENSRLTIANEEQSAGLLPIRDAIEQADGLDKGQRKGASKDEYGARLGIETGESVEKAKRLSDENSSFTIANEEQPAGDLDNPPEDVKRSTVPAREMKTMLQGNSSTQSDQRNSSKVKSSEEQPGTRKTLHLDPEASQDKSIEKNEVEIVAIKDVCTLTPKDVRVWAFTNETLSAQLKALIEQEQQLNCEMVEVTNSIRKAEKALAKHWKHVPFDTN